MNGNRKIVNKFGKDRATAEGMFSDVSKFALGEMVVVNDSKLPAILIKDNNMNTYEIHGVSVKGDAGTTEGAVKITPEIKSGQTIYNVVHTSVNVVKEQEDVPEDNINIVTAVEANPLGHVNKVKTGTISFKPINEAIATLEETVSNIRTEVYEGVGIDVVDGSNINVKIQEDNNFLSVNDNNELVVDDINTNKTIINEDITIEGGPLASTVKQAYPSGVLPKGTDIQSFLKALLCVEIYPTTSKNSPSFSLSLSNPSISANVNSGSLVEVGTEVVINSVVSKGVGVSKTDPKVSGFKHGYSDTIDGTINTSTSISTSYTYAQKSGEVYSLSASKSGFVGDVPASASNATYGSCSLASVAFTVAVGTNTYSVSNGGPAYEYSHPGIPSKYIVSNLGGRNNDNKSVSIAAVSTTTSNRPSSSASYSVTGVYPVYTNMVSETVSNTVDVNKRLSLSSGKVFEISFGPETDAYHAFAYPATHSLSTVEIYNTMSKAYETYTGGSSTEDATYTVQGNELAYKVWKRAGNAYSETTKFRFTLNKNLNTK